AERSGADGGPVGVDAIEDPLDLARRDEGADEDAGLEERGAAGGGPRVLPRDRGGDRVSSRGVPDERGASLGRDPEPLDPGGADVREDRPQDVDARGED